MTTATLEVLDYWTTAGGGVLNYYTLASQWGSHGYWGLSTDITSEATPKWDAIKKAARRSGKEGAAHGR